MPLLGKTSFTRQNPPPGLKPDDDVFFCKVTGEVFSDYTKFFDQSILCNSVIWTCSITGKHNLTFQEAKDSEAKALQTIVFPKDLQRPLLFLASLTRRRNASDITEDLYRFAKKRFFIGEVVDVVVSGARKSGIIKKIMAAKQSDTDDLIGGDSEDAVNHSTDANEEETSVEDALSYQYIVQEASIGSVLVVDAQNISRKRGGITREKCGMFVRQHCSFSSQKGFWTVKTDFIERFNVRSAKFSDFFVGPTPAFEKSPVKKPTTVQPVELNNSDEEEDDDDEEEEEDDFKMEKEKILAPKEGRKKKKEDYNEEERLAHLAKLKEKAEKQEKREALKRKADEEKAKKKEEKHKKKEEKKEEEKFLREWNKPRDDLSCEDLKDLPLSTPVTTCLSECFGDVLMVLEYLRSFKTSFDIDIPSSSISVAAFCQSIVESKVDGLFANLVQQLLEAIFHMELEYDDRGNVLGIPLKKLQLDGYSLTEILRRHFTKAAQLATDGSDLGLGLGLGGAASSFPDETTSEFLQLHPSVVQKMAKRNIFDLGAVDKLKILSGLINQLLMFPTSRALIEDNYEKLKQVQRNLRIHQIAVQKRERDEVQYTAKKKFEERMKEQSKNSESSNLVNGKPSTLLAEKEESVKTTKTTTRKKRSITELSEKDFEKMPVENIDWDQLSVEEKKCIKDWSVRKEKELVSEVAKLQPTSAILPIGRDRSYRRYWVLPSVPGIFVEDDDEFVSNDCLSPVKQKSSKPVDDKSDIKVHSGNDEGDVIGYMSLERQLNERGRVRWSFYRTAAELDALILSLNLRGIREGPLRLALEDQKEHLVEWMAKKGGSFNYLCTVSKQNAVKSEDIKHEPTMSVSSSSSSPEGGCREELVPTSSAGEACLEKALREMLLDMEERIHFGSLGVLKVRSRVEWRQDVEKCSSRNHSTTTKSGQSCDQSDSNLHSSAQKIDDDSKEELKVNSSRQDDVGEESVMRDLSQVLLQVLKMIETKYLNPPLGEDEETRKAKQKLALERPTPEADVELNDSDAIANEPESSVVEKWMESVGAATSLSQLYVLLSVLETSVAWSKSALHARCRICRRKNDGEHMLLCDGCDRGHHMYCLKPPITVVPSGDWFCPSCRPKDFVHLPSTPRKSYAEDSESESSEENNTTEEEEEKEEGNGRDEKDEEEEEEEEEEARSTSRSHEDLELSLQTKDEDDDSNEDDDDDDDDDDDYQPKSIDNKNGSATKSSSSAHKRGKRGRGGSSKRWKQDDYDDNDDDDDDDGANSSRRSSGQKLHSTRARRNESKRSCLKRSQDRRKALTPEATTSSSSSIHRGKRKSSTGVIEPNAGQMKTRGRPPRLSLESATLRGKRKIPSDWNDDAEDINLKRKKYSPIKSHFRAAENSMTVCEELVKELIKHDSCWPFRRPVTQRDAVDYFDIVKQPMDFKTIQNKIYRYQYFTSSSLLQDIHLIFYNCFLYNKPGTPVHSAGGDLEDFFNRRCKELNLGSQSQSSSKHRKRTM